MDWPHLVFSVLDWTWFLLGLSSLGAAAALVLRPGIFGSAPRFLGRVPLPLVFAPLPCAAALYDLARFKLYLLTADSAITANLAWSVAHGFGLRSLILGDNYYWAGHISFTTSLLSPLLRLYPSAGVLAAAQGAAVGSIPLAFFALARRRGGGEVLAWLVLLLTMAHPLFHELVRTILDSGVYAAPLFAWAAYFFSTGRRGIGLIFGLLMFSAREHVPLITMGAGLFLSFRGRPRLGAAVFAASVAILLAELKAIDLAQAGDLCMDNWSYFKNLGGSPGGMARKAISQPWSFPLALVWPLSKLSPVALILAHAGLLPLIGGVYFLPALAAWLPHQLAPAGSHFQALRAHYAAFVLGPLIWAMYHGLLSARRRLPAEGWRGLCAALLVIAGWGFLGAPRVFDPSVRVIPAAWKSAAPKALAMIGSESKVWADGYLLAHLAMRRYVKALPSQVPDCKFDAAYFAPDFVLLSEFWLRSARPEVRDSILGFLKTRDYRVRFREADLLLFSAPGL